MSVQSPYILRQDLFKVYQYANHAIEAPRWVNLEVGQQTMIALGCVLATFPKLSITEEPTEVMDAIRWICCSSKMDLDEHPDIQQ